MALKIKATIAVATRPQNISDMSMKLEARMIRYPSPSLEAMNSAMITPSTALTIPIRIPATMERMEAGFSPETNDWRYSMIMPDGSIFGITKGAGSERVEFCHTCHEAVGDTDNLFFVPEENRVRFLNQSALD